MASPQGWEVFTETTEIQVLLWAESGISWMSLA